ncbi:MAG: nuclear transport factor 2 family protein, partial [Planctomycetota bacterium]
KGILDRHAGSRAILEAVTKRRPLVHIHGHIHARFGSQGSHFNVATAGCRRAVLIDLPSMEHEVLEADGQGSTSVVYGDPMTQTDRFVDAFNRQDLDGLTSLLAADATAELVGSGVAPERGPERIREGPLAHMLGGEGEPLVAEIAGENLVLLAQGPQGPIDMAVTVESAGGAVTTLRFHTLWHDRETVVAFAEAAGRALADPG